jgi:hypothetical protein
MRLREPPASARTPFCYEAAPGQLNHLLISKDPVGVRFVDLGAPVVAVTLVRRPSASFRLPRVHE